MGFGGRFRCDSRTQDGRPRDQPSKPLAPAARRGFFGPAHRPGSDGRLQTNKAADNWFLQVELFDPHEPFYCTKEYRDLYGDTWDGPLCDWPPYEEVKDLPETIAHIRKCYAGLLSMTDHWVGKLLDKMSELGLLDDTMVIFTTDHGTMLGEHEYWMKLHMPCYNEMAKIPLVVRLPGGKLGGTREGRLTQTIDIMPTILKHHNGELPPHIQGIALTDTLAGKSTRQDVIFGYFGMATNITDGQIRLLPQPRHRRKRAFVRLHRDAHRLANRLDRSQRV